MTTRAAVELTAAGLIVGWLLGVAAAVIGLGAYRDGDPFGY